MRRFTRATAVTASVTAALLATVLTATPAGAASEWDLDFAGPAGTVAPFGHTGTATYGQTFTVPEGPETLESFSFEVDLPATVVFRVVLQAWDTAAGHATGPELYTTGPMSTAGAGVETLTFTPDVAITPGVYVFYATTSYDRTTGTGDGPWSADSANPYPDGQFVFFNNDDDTAALTTAAWDGLTSHLSYDLGFTVVYAAPVVPPVTPPVTPPPATPVVVAPAYTG